MRKLSSTFEEKGEEDEEDEYSEDKEARPRKIFQHLRFISQKEVLQTADQMSPVTISEDFGSPALKRGSKLRPKLDEYKVVAKPRKAKKPPKSMKRFSGRCRGPFWIHSSYMNVTPTHVCCGRIHKANDSKSKKKREVQEEDEAVATPREKTFEANKEMEEVKKATDERENNAATENDWVS